VVGRCDHDVEAAPEDGETAKVCRAERALGWWRAGAIVLAVLLAVAGGGCSHTGEVPPADRESHLVLGRLALDRPARPFLSSLVAPSWVE
jgi:hypothetical protein